MENTGLFSVLYPLLLATLVLNCYCDERKLHVVYMGERPNGEVALESTHHAMLQDLTGRGSTARELLAYSYSRSFNGFAARLTDAEAAAITEMEGVVSVMPNRVLKLHTTRSWDFMGFSQGKLSKAQEGNVIIGFLDTGIWPEHPSFNDTGYGPPPAKWKGSCITNNSFTCNNKIIGARYYRIEDSDDSDLISPRDTEGHGTHTASTAAGIELPGTSYFGLAEGVARGGVPGARIAVYKVCWSDEGCGLADILKAFDDAIADGVDIISVSLGADWVSDYFDDPIAIGSFHAMRNGILTSNSAGNSGPDPVTIANYAPWTMTVAASTIDRKFVTKLILGNGQFITGISINPFDLNGTQYPLIWGGDAVNYTFGRSPDDAKACYSDAINNDLIAGKIVFCEEESDGSTIFEAKGVGSIMAQTDIVNPDFAFSHPLPVARITPDDARKVLEYITSTKNPVATILVGETWKDAVAPKMPIFSSRGPNPITPDILKPDISAPGVDILAGWSPLASPSIYDKDTRSVYYNVLTGTSMACPHASATASYVKAAHPDWSPAAIKSAIMTTAYVMDSTRQRDREFAYGSGHINPTGAIDPGLVYDASETDYINFLCKQGYNTTTLRLVTGDDSTCETTTIGRAWDLNYPSFSLYMGDGDQIWGTFTRKVTNVGPANSSYAAIFYMPPMISISVEPSVLTFSAVGETQSFTLNITGPAITQQPIMSGALIWFDFEGNHEVRSPIIVYNYVPGAPYDIDSEDSKSLLSGNVPASRGSSKGHRSGIKHHK